MIAPRRVLLAALLTISFTAEVIAAEAADGSSVRPIIAKRVLGSGQAGENLLRPGDWRPYEKGFQREGDGFVCDNGTDARARRGVAQSVVLNQARPEPIIASCWSRAEEHWRQRGFRLFALS